ncbi:cytochrome P450 [Streptomyces mirabilis]|uniref:cytochrome P450 n=1 Tax=Streptomyces mirabilis TaxID=68239 RepID=UPI002F90847A
MAESPIQAAPLPMQRPTERQLDPPDGMRARHPISRVSHPDGHVGWLVTGHSMVRRILADPRFSSRHELMHYPFPGGEGVVMPPAPPGHFTALDPPEHTKFRRLLIGRFTVRRMRQLTGRIEQITADRLDAIAGKGSPADIVADYAYPIPALTTCELLGVPVEDHELFQREVRLMNALDAGEDQVAAAMTAVQDYLRELIAAKRSRPTDDVLSELAATDLTDEELEGVGLVLLAAGLDTTANTLSLGMLALLDRPEQLAAVRDDPATTDRAVEELLRYLSVVELILKSALEDVELDGHVIRAGDTVTLAVGAANRDPEHFPAPDRLDVGRQALGHLAFGHGIHQCLGQQLARVEMRIACPALLRRFPGLRLAVPRDEIRLRTGSITGLHRLPVAWDEG